MSRLAALVLVGATASTTLAAPQGKVVRVERARGTTATVPILCEVKSDGSGMCIGASPSLNDLVVVVDDTHVVAEVKVTHAQALSPKCDTLWNITGEIVRGDMSNVRSSKAIGLIDPATDRRSARRIEEDKLTSPSNNPDVHVALGVDRDGDGVADLIITQYACDAQGQPTSSGTAVDYCIDIWSKQRGSAMRRAWTTKLQACRP